MVRTKVLVWLLAALIVIVPTLAGAAYGDASFGLVMLGILLVVSACGVVFFAVVHLLTVGVHEFGHWFAGRMSGFRFCYVRIWIVELQNLTSGLAVRIVPTAERTDAAGLVGTLPRSMKGAVGRYAAMAAAGPIASLLLALAGYALYKAFEYPADDRAVLPGILRLLGICIALESGAVGLGNLVPFKTKSKHHSDGLILLNCWKHGNTIRNALAVHSILVPWNRCGVRARNWPKESIDLLIEKAGTDDWRIYARLLAFYHATDSYRFDEAMAYIREGLPIAEACKDPNPAMVQPFFVESAYALAYYEHDVVKARALLQRTQREDSERYQIYDRAHAAVLAAEGNIEESARVVAAAANRLQKQGGKRMNDSGLSELEFLRYILNRPLLEPLTPVGQTAG